MAITDRVSFNITQNKCNLKWNLINPGFRIAPLNIWTWTMYHFIQGQFQNLGFISSFLCARDTQLNKVESI